MKKMIALIAFFAFGNAHASMSLFCHAPETPSSCALKSESALEKLGCQVVKSETDCTYSLVEDPQHPGATIPSKDPYCDVTATNCTQPRVGNFGGETCDEGVKTQISKSDSVDNGYWMGLFGSYSRTICIVR